MSAQPILTADEAVAKLFANLDLKLARKSVLERRTYIALQLRGWDGRRSELEQWALKGGDCQCPAPKPFDDLALIERIRLRLLTMLDAVRVEASVVSRAA